MKTNVGHNSGINENTAELLKKYIEGVEIYQDQIKDLQGSKKEIFDEAKAAGFDVKTIKKIISIRKLEKSEVDEQQFLFESYCEAIQMDLFK
jgi:uncharacterized protein (UPF0335 family)